VWAGPGDAFWLRSVDIASLVSGLSQPIAAWPESLRGVPGDAPILVVGGTFDPPHLAHVKLPRLVRDRAWPAAVLLFVPAAASPFKQHAATTPGEHRLAMIRLAIEGVPHAGAWTDELDRASVGSPSYMIDTLGRLHSLRPAAPLGLLIGADQSVAFHKWKDPRGILSLARPFVLLREPLTTKRELLAALEGPGFWTSAEIERWIDGVIDVPLDPISATSIREQIRAGDPDAAFSHLCPAVADYVRLNRLYV
jgi:nicotinate-nucleotide adenylyltransferase